MSYTRRIERVHTKERVVAMTLTTAPWTCPSSPDKFGGRALTDLLLDTLQEYHALGTSTWWGHQRKLPPDLVQEIGPGRLGAGCVMTIIPTSTRTAGEGWSTTTGWSAGFCTRGTRSPTTGTAMSSLGKPFVYGKRGPFPRAGPRGGRPHPAAHPFSRDPYGYTMTMGRPPHYVDKIEGALPATTPTTRWATSI